MVEFEDDEMEDGFKLADVWAILRMQWKVVVAGVVIGVVVSSLSTLMATRYYRARAVVEISTLANQEMEMGKAVSNTNMVWNRDLYINTRIALLSSRPLRTKILERYEALSKDDGVGPNPEGYGLLSKSLVISKRKMTELLDISVTTPDPELSAALANLTAEVLRDESLESSKDAALNAKTWLASQVAVYEERIVEAHRDLLQYQKVHDMADVEDATTSLGARMSSLKEAYGAANTERVQHETILQERESLLRQGKTDALAKQLNTPSLQKLRERLTDLQANFAMVSATYGPKMAEYKAAKEQIEDAESLMRDEVRRTLKSERDKLAVLTAAEEALAKEISGGKSQLLDVQGRLADYEKKRLDLETAQGFYGQMMERSGELELQSKTQLNNVRITEPARPNKSPVSPNALTNLIGGLFGGLTLGLALAFAREWLDDTISSQLDVATYLKLPLLGLVPKIGEVVNDEADRTLYTHRNPKSNIAEAIRGLRTVIELNPHGDPPKRLLVTSALSSEGKTSTAVRLAITYANLGRRVVLVDSDLRRPRIHKVLGVQKEPGFAEAIGGQGRIVDMLHETEIPNLMFVASGKGGDRPTEILGSLRTPSVLEDLDNEFDMVIIDSPPSAMLSDARILSRHVDGVVVMVKEKSTSRVIIRQAIRGLQQVGARVLGVVVNEIDMTRQSTYRYYGYGYGYGDYYADDDQDAAAK